MRTYLVDAAETAELAAIGTHMGIFDGSEANEATKKLTDVQMGVFLPLFLQVEDRGDEGAHFHAFEDLQELLGVSTLVRVGVVEGSWHKEVLVTGIHLNDY
jgi:hypothetical protein